MRTATTALLDMIERKAPLLMRTGDIFEEREPRRMVTEEVREWFTQLWHEGKSRTEIANLTGFHFQTVWVHTRHLSHDRR